MSATDVMVGGGCGGGVMGCGGGDAMGCAGGVMGCGGGGGVMVGGGGGGAMGCACGCCGCFGSMTGLPQKTQNLDSFTIPCPQFEQNKISPPLKLSQLIIPYTVLHLFHKKAIAVRVLSETLL